REERGAAVPLQAQPLARWPDGSVRWLLLDFQADPPAGGSQRYTLTWQGAGRSAAPADPVLVATDGTPSLRSGDLSVAAGEASLLQIADRAEVRFTLIDADGRVYSAVAENVAVEAAGPLRGTLVLTGAFRDPSGERVCQ